jgi:hypothetical protein
MQRREDQRLLTGRGQFVADLVPRADQARHAPQSAINVRARSPLRRPPLMLANFLIRHASAGEQLRLF